MIDTAVATSAAQAALETAQRRLTAARGTVVDREREVQEARALLPPRVDLLLEDEVLAAAMQPLPEEEALRVRLAELDVLVPQAKAAWNREGRRVVASQSRPGPEMAVLDEDLRFGAADRLLQTLQVEQNDLRRALDVAQRVRVCNASAARHDASLDDAQAQLLSFEGQTGWIERVIARAVGR